MRRKSAEKLKKSREDSMKYWDERMAHQLRSPLKPADLVLVYNKAIETNWGLIFKNKLKGPYRVIRQINNVPYELEELDGTELERKFAAYQVKRFYPRGKLINTKEDTEEEQSEENESINEEEVFEETTESEEEWRALTWNAGDSIKWRGGCGIPYHSFHQAQAHITIEQQYI
ncbi:hypothetical protein O181_119824 [Austropuccinia psidii MF-1]|uniref:Uncharacterized protein n=1 Tax=Austropuccinia psidii MF-1 TaxID=1389203 RepID=A0A9Q3KFH0_9BASI|nr:hypothetical protein [Austropuccinia psidii MF-1]